MSNITIKVFFLKLSSKNMKNVESQGTELNSFSYFLVIMKNCLHCLGLDFSKHPEVQYYHLLFEGFCLNTKQETTRKVLNIVPNKL